ncbi:hypothetical protein Tco_1090567 [Tanacetum coccineum]|uniref:Uncharacterized protein n=1 Tax=Tanacetum coccineum TaxID=301880 RepID=A0ABQ5I4L7_9ASTR
MGFSTRTTSKRLHSDSVLGSCAVTLGLGLFLSSWPDLMTCEIKLRRVRLFIALKFLEAKFRKSREQVRQQGGDKATLEAKKRVRGACKVLSDVVP